MEFESSKRTTISEIFLDLNLPKDVRILDVACGIGVVAEELKPFGYDNIDGLDPVEGYLVAAKAKGLYKNVYKEVIDIEKPTSISDETYDIVICCAGFFHGLISPLALPELARIVKTSGLVIWNIASGYEEIGSDFQRFDSIVEKMVEDAIWKFEVPIRRFEKLVFTDCGAAYLAGYKSSGVATDGLIYTMRKL